MKDSSPIHIIRILTRGLGLGRVRIILIRTSITRILFHITHTIRHIRTIRGKKGAFRIAGKPLFYFDEFFRTPAEIITKK
ncbi:hypothetical protein [Bacillus glycinifermentans]|uniref:Uncharacterized protein n=1 Tax=Bacillus glycinifermentans TaxID=1664069 RepID=A0ABU6H870_9BACI|nr:hypothetical protein [Bacillus glycinifermentans]MEC0486201.1 hypothetical protein [Bacillus glycinifermentans]MEC0494915.1 hypothetical protein [Bacillus glycinifermentans]MEC0540941.1 hypothetical protein [Bacillus glycinifermentans]